VTVDTVDNDAAIGQSLEFDEGRLAVTSDGAKAMSVDGSLMGLQALPAAADADNYYDSVSLRGSTTISL